MQNEHELRMAWILNPKGPSKPKSCQCDYAAQLKRIDEIIKETNDEDDRTVWGAGRDTAGFMTGEWVLEHLGAKGLAGWIQGVDFGFLGYDYYEIWNHTREANEKIKQMQKECDDGVD